MRLLLVLLLAGCASRVPDIDFTNQPPDGWPKLEERIGYVKTDQLEKYCLASRPGYAPACALVDFAREICWIYLATKDPAILEHERAHCRGYDHVGDRDRSKAALERYKKSLR